MNLRYPVVRYDKTNDSFSIGLIDTIRGSLKLDPNKKYEWALKHLDTENNTFCVEVMEIKK